MIECFTSRRCNSSLCSSGSLNVMTAELHNIYRTLRFPVVFFFLTGSLSYRGLHNIMWLRNYYQKSYSSSKASKTIVFIIMLTRFFFRCVEEAFRRYMLPLSFGDNAASIFRIGLEKRGRVYFENSVNIV
jgi:hypothetical protein